MEYIILWWTRSEVASDSTEKLKRCGRRRLIRDSGNIFDVAWIESLDRHCRIICKTLNFSTIVISIPYTLTRVTILSNIKLFLHEINKCKQGSWKNSTRFNNRTWKPRFFDVRYFSFFSYIHTYIYNRLKSLVEMLGQISSRFLKKSIFRIKPYRK